MALWAISFQNNTTKQQNKNQIHNYGKLRTCLSSFEVFFSFWVVNEVNISMVLPNWRCWCHLTGRCWCWLSCGCRLTLCWLSCGCRVTLCWMSWVRLTCFLRKWQWLFVNGVVITTHMAPTTFDTKFCSF